MLIVLNSKKENVKRNVEIIFFASKDHPLITEYMSILDREENFYLLNKSTTNDYKEKRTD